MGNLLMLYSALCFMLLRTWTASSYQNELLSPAVPIVDAIIHSHLAGRFAAALFVSLKRSFVSLD